MPIAAKEIATQIIEAIDKDELVLPTLPEVALSVREVADDPEASITDLSRVISQDAALSARIIKVANSPLFRAPREIEDLNMALSRLGMQYTSNLAIGLAMEQMFQATNDFVDKKLREVWARSGEIAGICHMLCKHRTKLRPDQAALSGLVHQIGVLPILAFAEDNQELLQNKAALEKIIEAIHPHIGIKILTSWEFHSDMRQVPKDCFRFTRQAPQADYADIVTIAMLQSYIADGSKYTDTDLTQVTAFARLGIEPVIETAEGEDLSEEMAAAMAMLT